jgi:hypothetical protein
VPWPAWGTVPEWVAASSIGFVAWTFWREAKERARTRDEMRLSQARAVEISAGLDGRLKVTGVGPDGIEDGFDQLHFSCHVHNQTQHEVRDVRVEVEAVDRRFSRRWSVVGAERGIEDREEFPDQRLTVNYLECERRVAQFTDHDGAIWFVDLNRNMISSVENRSWRRRQLQGRYRPEPIDDWSRFRRVPPTET